jgi:methylphosphotriester-DNA--protein-cysteine methyltransferase
MAHAIRFIYAEWRKGKLLKEIAERYRVDAGNLERAFRRREGVTIKQFIDRQRKDYLLSHLGDSMLYGHEIGAAMGFSNKRAFYRWVERAFGISFTALRA